MSNLALHQQGTLDPSRQTLMKDCLLKKDSLVLQLKWSKGNQLGTDTLSQPRTSNPLYCPVTNWQHYLDTLQNRPYKPDWPWLIHQQAGLTFWPTRDGRESSSPFHMADSSTDRHSLHAHSLCRGGATFFAESGLPPRGHPTPRAVAVRRHKTVPQDAQFL